LLALAFAMLRFVAARFSLAAPEHVPPLRVFGWFLIFSAGSDAIPNASAIALNIPELFIITLCFG